MARSEPLPPIPDKLLFKIGEVSRLVGVKPHVIRFWEGSFPQLRPEKTTTGHRMYAREDVLLLRRIRALLHDRGYTIAGARSLVAQGEAAVEAVLGRARPAPEPDPAAETQALAKLTTERDDAREACRRAERALEAAREEAAFWREQLRNAESARTALIKRLRAHGHALRHLVSEAGPDRPEMPTDPADSG